MGLVLSSLFCSINPYACIGEGNGNPLQCSCLENPRDSGAWWAAICGVAQSWTWLMWLSSSRNPYVCFCASAMLFFLSTPSGMWDLPVPPPVGAWSLNHWTARKPPCCFDSCSFVILSEVLAGGGQWLCLQFCSFSSGLLWQSWAFGLPINFRIIYCCSVTLLSLCVCVVCVCVCARTLNCLVMSDLFSPMDCSPPGSSILGIFQARILERDCHFLLQGIFPT